MIKSWKQTQQEERDRIQRMIDDCQGSGFDFSLWEQDFLDSVADQFEDRGTLSERQKEILEEIWEKI